MLEILNFLLSDLIDLVYRHEVDSFNTIERIETTFLLNHEFIQDVDKDETVVGCGDEEPLVVGKLGG